MNISLSRNNFLAFRRMFYLVSPSESTYDVLESIPNFVTEAIPFFLLLIIIEMIIISRKRKTYTGIDWSDAISSVSAGILSRIPLLFSKSIEIITYIWVHNNCSLLSLNPHSALVWFVGFIGVDFGYYWVHRASHEVSLFWGGHQVHHSSQRYNLTTALRQGFFQLYFSWMFYLPLSLILPSSVFIVHLQFNLLYQFWIHTEVIGKLGKLEFILNTPSHHRVHHGRNKYCIDKNYGGTLIIFDRIFGTFQAEDDEVVYGHVHPIKTWNPIKIQTLHFEYIFQQIISSKDLSEKFKSIFFGPGWESGSQRLGSVDALPEPETPIDFWHKDVSRFVFVYSWINFIIAIIIFVALSVYKTNMEFSELGIGAIFLLFTLIQIGRLLDGNSVLWSEGVRIAIIFGIILRNVSMQQNFIPNYFVRLNNVD